MLVNVKIANSIDMGHPNPNLAGDLAYYPSGKSGTSKSFSDTGFGMPRQQLAYQPPYQSGYVSLISVSCNCI